MINFSCLLMSLFLLLQYPLIAVDDMENAQPNQSRKLLVIGCSRSGTTYISVLLCKAGLRIGHEELFKDGCSSWPLVFDTEHPPWGPSCKDIHFEHIFHQIRDPLKTISSVSTHEIKKSWEYICRKIPKIKMSDSTIVRAAKYWYYWNTAAEKKAEWSYKVEDIEQIWDEMCQRLDFPLDREALQTVPKTTNTWGPHAIEVTWKSLKRELPRELYIRILVLAKKYGYPTRDQ